MAPVVAFLSMPGPFEMLVILGVGVLLFGSRLPEVGKSLGKSLMEFKKGLQGLEDEFRSVGQTTSSAMNSVTATYHEDKEDREEATAPKFVPPPAEETQQAPQG